MPKSKKNESGIRTPTEQKGAKSPKKQKLRMDFISMRSLEGLTVDEKIQKILKTVKQGHIVVLDQALDADEEANLVTSTMHDIKGEFTGIEFCSLPAESGFMYNLFLKFLETIIRKKFTKPGLTLVGPSSIISEIKRDPNAFYVSAEL